MPNGENQGFDLKALSEDYVPQDLLVRTAEKQRLSRYFRFAEMGVPFTLFIYGESGTGKTCTIKKLMEENLGSKVEAVYVNCWEKDTLNAILTELLLRTGARYVPPDCNAKMSELKKTLRLKKFLLILDEIDKLQDKEKLLYNLFEVGTCLMIIANDKYSLSDMDSRIHSRAFHYILEFKRYTPDELLLILKNRAEGARLGDMCPDCVLKEISGGSNGDARLAIQTLRLLVVEALNSGKRLEVMDVKAIVGGVAELRTNSVLQKMTRHHRLMYDIIRSNPNILSSVLFKRYSIRARAIKLNPVARRTYTQYITALERSGLIVSEKARMKGRNRLFRCV